MAGKIGFHICADFYGCNGKMLDDYNFIKDTLLQAVKKSDMNLINLKLHKFQPHGLTGYALLSTSHLAIHTWSELNYASIDIYSCGEKEGVVNAFLFILSRLNPKNIMMKSFTRSMSDSSLYH